MSLGVLIMLGILAGESQTPPAIDDDPRMVVIESTGARTVETPVLVPLEEPLEPGDWVLESLSNGSRKLPAQAFLDNGRPYLAFLLPPDQSTEPRKFRLKAGSTGTEGVTLRKEAKGSTAITLNGRPFTSYLTQTGPKPILFPVLGPGGEPYTRAFPMRDEPGEDRDHPHQRSFWMTHGNVNGVDFWSEMKGHGSIREVERITELGGPVVGVIRTRNDWLDSAGKRVCSDERVLRVHNTTGSRLLDFDVTIRATDGPVTFGDTKEGMFGVRVASSMDVKRKQGGKILNAEGLTDAAAWGKPSPWVDYTGPVAGKVVGIAILNHPESFRYPTTWHVRDYGLFAANPFGYKDFGRTDSGAHTIAPGDSITFRYRLILHEGSTEAAAISSAFEAYRSPVRVTIE
jgi:hypothetical protein